MKNAEHTARRNVSRYLLIFLGMLTVVGCSPAPRYTLHEGTDPDNGTRTTIRLDSSTGEAWQLDKIPANGGTLSLWRPILERDIAIKAAAMIRKEVTNATNSNFTY
jgi:hypothetical protein